ncbi:OstA-like protein [Cyclonatronum proteinivorum]|nr:OstA-like protein [Cyclonatronum proteinivorum]
MFQSESKQAYAQTQVRLLFTESLRGETTELGRVRILRGNVEMETDDLHILADSVYQYLDRNFIDAFGNIQIRTENQHIWADTLRYNTLTDISRFRGRVVVEGPSARLFSQEMLYNFIFEIAEFPRQIRMEDENGTLQADRGFYFSLPDSAAFYGNVQIADATQYAEADTLYAVRSADFFKMRGNVYLEDFEERTRMRGGFSQSDSTGFRELRDHARLQRVNEARTDTTFLAADRIEVTNRDTLSTVDGFGNVEIWAERYAALSEQSTYNDQTGLFRLTGDARLWQKDLQLSGETIDIQLIDDEIESLFAFPEPVAVTPDSLTGRFNQIIGDSLRIYFDAGEISKMRVEPNSEMIIHERDENDRPEFAIQISAERLIMHFNEGNIDSLKYYRTIDGRYIPEALNPGEIRLQGFQYEPERRPAKPAEWLFPSRDPIPEEPLFPLPRRNREFLDEQDISAIEPE